MARTVRSVEEMHDLARELAHSLLPGEGEAQVVALSGDLGSGKTTFMQGFAHAFGVADAVTSPTFVLEKVYKLAGQKFAHLIHIDAYRLEGPEEARHLGWEELLRDPLNLVCVEWAERLGDAIPENARRLNFRFVDEETREVDAY